MPSLCIPLGRIGAPLLRLLRGPAHPPHPALHPGAYHAANPHPAIHPSAHAPVKPRSLAQPAPHPTNADPFACHRTPINHQASALQPPDPADSLIAATPYEQFGAAFFNNGLIAGPGNPAYGPIGSATAATAAAAASFLNGAPGLSLSGLSISHLAQAGLLTAALATTATIGYGAGAGVAVATQPDPASLQNPAPLASIPPTSNFSIPAPSPETPTTTPLLPEPLAAAPGPTTPGPTTPGPTTPGITTSTTPPSPAMEPANLPTAPIMTTPSPPPTTSPTTTSPTTPTGPATPTIPQLFLLASPSGAGTTIPVSDTADRAPRLAAIVDLPEPIGILAFLLGTASTILLRRPKPAP